MARMTNEEKLIPNCVHQANTEYGFLLCSISIVDTRIVLSTRQRVNAFFHVYLYILSSVLIWMNRFVK